MCACSIPNAVSRPTPSSLMSLRVYAARVRAASRSPAEAAATTSSRGAPCPSNFEERPQSRLSKLITKRPPPARRSQNPRGQPINWVPNPMTRSTGGSLGEPTVSYSREIPPGIVTCGMAAAGYRRADRSESRGAGPVHSHDVAVCQLAIGGSSSPSLSQRGRSRSPARGRATLEMDEIRQADAGRLRPRQHPGAVLAGEGNAAAAAS